MGQGESSLCCGGQDNEARMISGKSRDHAERTQLRHPRVTDMVLSAKSPETKTATADEFATIVETMSDVHSQKSTARGHPHTPRQDLAASQTNMPMDCFGQRRGHKSEVVTPGSTQALTGGRGNQLMGRTAYTPITQGAYSYAMQRSLANDIEERKQQISLLSPRKTGVQTYCSPPPSPRASFDGASTETEASNRSNTDCSLEPHQSTGGVHNPQIEEGEWGRFEQQGYVEGVNGRGVVGAAAEWGRIRQGDGVDSVQL
mmetsp:Transcript_47660/g.95413  ORF Transcript_47660/g.95413 Transcript_47660/m.95413 type:complete len:259 (+) Transcript_47660:161-937(+)